MIVKETRIFELDDDIAKDVIELNRKGYMTEFTCGGHLEDFDNYGLMHLYHMGTYIAFSNIAKLRLWNKDEYNIPNNWIFEEYDKQLIIRRYYDKEEVDLFTKEQLLQLTHQELHKWVESLPQRKLFNMIDYDIREFK